MVRERPTSFIEKKKKKKKNQKKKKKKKKTPWKDENCPI